MLVILSETIALAQHPERSGGSIPGRDDGYRDLPLSVILRPVSWPIASPEGKDLGFDSGETQPRDPSVLRPFGMTHKCARGRAASRAQRREHPRRGPRDLPLFVILRSGFGDDRAASRAQRREVSALRSVILSGAKDLHFGPSESPPRSLPSGNEIAFARYDTNG